MSLTTDIQRSGELSWEDRLKRGGARSRLTLNPEYQELKFRLHRRLLDKINLEALASIDNERVRVEVRNALMSLMDEESTLLSSLEDSRSAKRSWMRCSAWGRSNPCCWIRRSVTFWSTPTNRYTSSEMANWN